MKGNVFSANFIVNSQIADTGELLFSMEIYLVTI